MKLVGGKPGSSGYPPDRWLAEALTSETRRPAFGWGGTRIRVGGSGQRRVASPAWPLQWRL